MNLSTIRANFAFGKLPELGRDQEWAKDPGCPEGGLYPRAKFERTPAADEFRRPRAVEVKFDEPEDCPKGHHIDYTHDNRRIFVPNHRG